MAEPWLRGPIDAVSPLLSPMLYGFQQAREDLAIHTEALSTAQIWASPHGLGSVGFHLRHIMGSIDRLLTYLQGRQLSAEQLSALQNEKEPGASREDLLTDLDAALRRAEQIIRSVDVATLVEPRSVGRKLLPTTVLGLLVHIAEHTQRHVGQAISAAKLARATHAPELQ